MNTLAERRDANIEGYHVCQDDILSPPGQHLSLRHIKKPRMAGLLVR